MKKKIELLILAATIAFLAYVFVSYRTYSKFSEPSGLLDLIDSGQFKLGSPPPGIHPSTSFYVEGAEGKQYAVHYLDGRRFKVSAYFVLNENGLGEAVAVHAIDLKAGKDWWPLVDQDSMLEFFRWSRPKQE